MGGLVAFGFLEAGGAVLAAFDSFASCAAALGAVDVVGRAGEVVAEPAGDELLFLDAGVRVHVGAGATVGEEPVLLGELVGAPLCGSIERDDIVECGRELGPGAVVVLVVLLPGLEVQPRRAFVGVGQPGVEATKP